MDNKQFRFGLALKPKTGGIKKWVREALARLYLLQYKGFDPLKLCCATVLYEGTDERAVEGMQRRVAEIAKECGGVEAGEEAGRLGYFL